MEHFIAKNKIKSFFQRQKKQNYALNLLIEAAILEVAFLEHGFATLFRLFLWATRVCLIIALSLRLH